MGDWALRQRTITPASFLLLHAIVTIPAPLPIKHPRTLPVLGTPLAVTSYAELSEFLFRRAAAAGPFVVDFSNTQIVTMRRHEEGFRETTQGVDLFVPDGMPLIWCLNRQGAGLKDRVYGPTFLRECIARSPQEVRHYFFGASKECLDALLKKVIELNPGITICGSRTGYFSRDDETRIAEDILQARPDMLWVGLGTPKQQEWINRWKGAFPAGVLLAVGFAFDVNAGTKPDAPGWMQKYGLTWIYRIASEPRRLAWRYLKWNSLFLFYLLRDFLDNKSPEGW